MRSILSDVRAFRVVLADRRGLGHGAAVVCRSTKIPVLLAGIEQRFGVHGQAASTHDHAIRAKRLVHQRQRALQEAAGEPLWRLLGARDRAVPGYASALDGPLADDDLVRAHRPFAERGFTAVKIKGGLDVAADVRRLGLVRDLYAEVHGASPRLMLAANESWSSKEAIAHVARIEEQVDLAWVEEPVRRWDVESHAMITRAVRAAVATGENLTGLEQFRPLVQAGAVDVVQTGSVWGITHFLRVAALAHAFDLPVSPVGYNANPLAHAAASVPNHLALEVQDLDAPVGLRVDQELVDGCVVLGDEPGLGIQVDELAIAELAESADWGRSLGPHVRPERAGRRLISPEPHVFAPSLSVVDPVVEATGGD